MPVDLKIRTPEKNFNRDISRLSPKDKSCDDAPGDEISTVFRDFHISAFSKAVNISPAVTSVTLGAKSTVKHDEKPHSDSIEESDSVLHPVTIRTSTPDKNKSNKSVHLRNLKEFLRLKKNAENLSPISTENKMNADSGISYQKLLSEFDVQRRLTVDKVMRERIQNMHDTGKIIRDNLEHLKQTKQEEALARRLLLERKILDDIHEQEVLNKPKREAEWAKDNLKEAQRIQERNQKVKKAEEEARKKSESILLKRKQIDQILNCLQKEYNQEYKSMFEFIKSCKDKISLSATQSKILKECNGTCEKIYKKCKQGDISEEDVENAKKLVETIKMLHEKLCKEIDRINEELKAKEESEKKIEVQETTVQKTSRSNSTPASVSSSAYFVMFESSPQRRSFVHTTGRKNSNEVNQKVTSTSPLKRKSERIVTNTVSKKPQKVGETHNEGTEGDRPKNVPKNKLASRSIEVFKAQKNNLSKGSEVFDKGDIERLRNKSSSAFRKTSSQKIKKVRFSDSTEIIDSNYFSLFRDFGTYSGVSDSIKNQQNLDISAVAGSDEETSCENLSDCFDPRSLETYIKLKSALENCEKTIESLVADDSLKKFRFNCQKAVNIPVNAISPVSGPHLSDKYLKLHNLLSGRTVEVGDIKLTATQHPLGVLYCKHLLAKKFVRQGDLTVSSKPDAAFSIAAVLASLWVDFPDFGQLVLAHFQSACPYLAPVFLPQVEGQTDEEYHRSLGYHYSQSGEVEKQDSFLKRMSGIMRLYAALLISNVRQPGKMNPLGLSEGWRWISALLNLEPRPDICATLLYDFLDVAGHEMFRAYGGQFKKMLAYICQEYFPKLEKVTPSSAGGPMVRLEGFLQKVLKEESIPQPQGILPPNFW